MTEHLFKLKKDGKTVGYLKINPKGKWDKLHPMEDKFMFRPVGEAHKDKWYCIGYKCLDFNSGHPFVTKDKNSDDVFADDKVDSMGNRCLVMWHKVMFQWCLWHIEGDYYFGSLQSKQVIELIEDKDNDQK